MKITSTAVAAIFICLITCVSASVLAQDEGTSASNRSPLLPNFYPAAGQWILNSELLYDETTSKSGFKINRTLANERLRYGVTNQTEFNIAQKYLIDRNSALPQTRFYSPELSLTHRFVQINDQFFSAAVTYMPATDRGTLMQNKEQIELALKYSMLVEENYWLTGEVSHSHTGKRNAAFDEEIGALVSDINSLSAKLKLSKQRERTAYSAYLGVTKKSNYKFIPFYMNCYYYAPACTAYANLDLIPSLGIEVSHKFASKTFVTFSYSAIHQTGTATIYPTGSPPSQSNRDIFRQIFGIYLTNEF
jgi:hypothetical protein